MDDTVATQDPGRELMELFVKELVRRLKDAPGIMTAAELNVVRQALSDNSITLANVRRGDFGAAVKKVAEDFPFPVEGSDPPQPTYP